MVDGFVTASRIKLKATCKAVFVRVDGTTYPFKYRGNQIQPGFRQGYLIKNGLNRVQAKIICVAVYQQDRQNSGQKVPPLMTTG